MVKLLFQAANAQGTNINGNKEDEGRSLFTCPKDSQLQGNEHQS